MSARRLLGATIVTAIVIVVFLGSPLPQFPAMLLRLAPPAVRRAASAPVRAPCVAAQEAGFRMTRVARSLRANTTADSSPPQPHWITWLCNGEYLQPASHRLNTHLWFVIQLQLWRVVRHGAQRLRAPRWMLPLLSLVAHFACYAHNTCPWPFYRFPLAAVSADRQTLEELPAAARLLLRRLPTDVAGCLSPSVPPEKRRTNCLGRYMVYNTG